MGYWIGNCTSESVSVALGVRYYTPPPAYPCPNDNGWQKLGWYNLAPYQTILPQAFAYPLTQNNPYVVIWAYSESTSYNNPTGPYQYWVPSDGRGPFEQCLSNNTTPISCDEEADFYAFQFPAGADTAITYIGIPQGQIYSAIRSPTLWLENVEFNEEPLIYGFGFPVNSNVSVSASATSTNGEGSITPAITVTTSSQGDFFFQTNFGLDLVNGVLTYADAKAVDQTLGEFVAEVQWKIGQS